MEQDDTVVNSNKSTLKPGTLLKNKRESLGYSKQDVANRLRLRSAIIDSIENDELECDQVATFTRGYLLSYAKAVGVSDEEILQSYEEHCKVAEPDQQSMQSFSKQTKRDKNDNRLMTLTWIILLVIVGMSSLWWYQNSQQDTLSPQPSSSKLSVPSASEIKKAVADEEFATVSDLTNPDNGQSAASAETSPEPSAKDDTQAESAQSANPADNRDSAEPNTQANTSAQSTDSPASQTDTQDSQPAVSSHSQLTMRFDADCWIQIKDATGKTLAIGIKKKGQSLDLRGDKPFKVVLGAPEVVHMSFDNESVDLSGYTSGKVARLTLP
ncbi:cytoskeleton protein RodZ [Vibrio zhugei]|uniref:Cytoskeleton protein RodZ n=2 Tax=Vibrio zhugei TaxID=2479546 RepID=A0ABV7CAA5_9VIBR